MIEISNVLEYTTNTGGGKGWGEYRDDNFVKTESYTDKNELTHDLFLALALFLSSEFIGYFLK